MSKEEVISKSIRENIKIRNKYIDILGLKFPIKRGNFVVVKPPKGYSASDIKRVFNIDMGIECGYDTFIEKIANG